MPTTIVTTNGRVTIPREIRAELGLRAGDKIEFVKMENGSYQLWACNRSVMELKGIFPKPSRPVSIEDMNAAIAEGATKGYRRRTKRSS